MREGGGGVAVVVCLRAARIRGGDALALSLTCGPPSFFTLTGQHHDTPTRVAASD